MPLTGGIHMHLVNLEGGGRGGGTDEAHGVGSGWCARGARAAWLGQFGRKHSVHIRHAPMVWGPPPLNDPYTHTPKTQDPLPPATATSGTGGPISPTQLPPAPPPPAPTTTYSYTFAELTLIRFSPRKGAPTSTEGGQT